MKFLTKAPSLAQNFSLVYDKQGYGFDVEPFNGLDRTNIVGFTSIMINELRLEIDEDGTVLYVWGFCPLIKFEETSEFPTRYEVCTLVALLDKPPIPGVSINLDIKDWPLYINKPKGWVCLGNPMTRGDQVVEFAPQCVAVLENQEMRAVWLHPDGFPWSEKAEPKLGFFRRIIGGGSDTKGWV